MWCSSDNNKNDNDNDNEEEEEEDDDDDRHKHLSFHAQKKKGTAIIHTVVRVLRWVSDVSHMH